MLPPCLAHADPDTPPQRNAQEAGELMESLRGSGTAATAVQVSDAHRLAAAIEAAEGHFAAAAGDLAFNAVLRTDFDVGRLLTAVKARRDEYDEVAEHWTRDGRHGAPLPQVRLQFCSVSAGGHKRPPCRDTRLQHTCRRLVGALFSRNMQVQARITSVPCTGHGAVSCSGCIPPLRRRCAG